MKLWLDDVRSAPDGWTHCRTLAEAKFALAGGDVEEASLDHDIDVCPICHGTEEAGGAILVPCEHRQNGLQLVDWMVRTGAWPARTPRVHSANEEAAATMRDIIAAYWKPRDDLFRAPRFTCWCAFGGGDADELLGFWCHNTAASAFALGRWRRTGGPEAQLIHVVDQTGLKRVFLVSGSPTSGFSLEERGS